MYFSFHLGWYCIHSDIVHLENVVVVGGGVAERSKPVKYDESYLSTVP